jgi:hypothetical protein
MLAKMVAQPVSAATLRGGDYVLHLRRRRSGPALYIKSPASYVRTRAACEGQELWLPGGQLPAGNNEAVLDLGGAPRSSWKDSPVTFD